LHLDVAANQPFTHYRASVVAECPVGANAKWEVWVGHLNGVQYVNGTMNVSVNGVLQKTWDAQGGGDKWTGSIAQNTSSKLQLDFYPDNVNESSWVHGVHITVKEASNGFEDCLDVQNCLKVFGDDTLPSYQIRSSSQRQLQCLSQSGLPADLNAKCNEWLTCIRAEDVDATGDTGEDLITFLQTYLRGAGITTDSSLTVKRIVTDTPACFNPAHDDPEALDCNCKDVLVDICGLSNETCYKDHMCNNPNVCQSWKTDMGCPTSFMELLNSRKEDASKVHNDEDPSADALWAETRGKKYTNLDTTNIGKCGG